MKFLLAAKHPPGGSLPIGGVQTWCATVAAELRAEGHEVAFWGPEWPLPAGRFDVGVLANLVHTAPAEAACDRLLRISHGIVPDEAGGAGFAATSEEVAERWGCDAGVIRQPIDLAFWRPGACRRDLLVHHSYRGGLPFLEGLAARRGLEFRRLAGLAPDAVREALQRARVVVATGRAALEAMACGAAVVVADARRYQGPLLDTNPRDAMLRNYSGRGGIPASPEAVDAAIGEALLRGSLRGHVERHHDARRVTAQLLEAVGC